MSIEDEIENGSDFNSHNAFAAVSEKLAKSYDNSKIVLSSIDQLEHEIKRLQEEYRRITEDEMPQLMSELGVSAVKLPSGEIIEVQNNIHCGIPAHSKEQAYQWLQENNHGDLIKNELTIKFARNEGNLVGQIKGAAESLGLKFDEKHSVHAGTLKSFVKEQMSLGINLPKDLFGIYIRRSVEVKQSKSKG